MPSWEGFREACSAIYGAIKNKLQPIDEPDYAAIGAMTAIVAGGEVEYSMELDKDGNSHFLPKIKVEKPGPEAVKAAETIIGKALDNQKEQSRNHTIGVVIVGIVGSLLNAWLGLALIQAFFGA